MTLPGPLIAYKITAIVVVFFLGMVLITNKVSQIKDTAYKAGVTATEQVAQAALTEQNATNAKRTGQLETDLAQATRRYEQLASQRRQREQVIVERIEQVLPAQENCQITPELLTLRNQLRTQ